MTLFLDSSSREDAPQAEKLGYFSGITTNPTLRARLRPDVASGQIRLKVIG
jgi:transaldolase